MRVLMKRWDTQIELDKKAQQVKASMLAASRYHRLGGRDLDAAIVHECLIPALVSEKGLSPHELTYGQKKKGLEPQLLSTAESLKIGLCKETDRLDKFGKYDFFDKKELVARQPGLLKRSDPRRDCLKAPRAAPVSYLFLLCLPPRRLSDLP